MTVYYVATNGNDSGTGSADSPWRTISKAMRANLKPGDEVVVRSGTYNEAVIVNKDGAEGNYITPALRGSRWRQDRCRPATSPGS